jgi:hypothetical protein
MENTMSASLKPSSSCFPAASPLAGLWRLAPRRTISLKPAANGVLRIVQGRVWVTTGVLQGLAGQPDSGDLVLHAGDEWAVPAGVHLVMECWPVQPDDAVRFDFSECETTLAVAPRFQREVANPARDLGQELWAAAGALGRATWAFARVLRGLAGYGEYLVAGRGRVMSPLEAGPP